MRAMNQPNGAVNVDGRVQQIVRAAVINEVLRDGIRVAIGMRRFNHDGFPLRQFFFGVGGQWVIKQLSDTIGRGGNAQQSRHFLRTSKSRQKHQPAAQA